MEPSRPQPTREQVLEAKEELYALVLAWQDRGFSFPESAVIVAAVAHMLLGMTPFKPSDLIDVLGDTWERKKTINAATEIT
jgi:Cdc6-like AAA superfamily ATPase